MIMGSKDACALEFACLLWRNIKYSVIIIIIINEFATIKLSLISYLYVHNVHMCARSTHRCKHTIELKNHKGKNWKLFSHIKPTNFLGYEVFYIPFTI